MTTSLNTIIRILDKHVAEILHVNCLVGRGGIFVLLGIFARVSAVEYVGSAQFLESSKLGR